MKSVHRGESFSSDERDGEPQEEKPGDSDRRLHSDSLDSRILPIIANSGRGEQELIRLFGQTRNEIIDRHDEHHNTDREWLICPLYRHEEPVLERTLTSALDLWAFYRATSQNAAVIITAKDDAVWIESLGDRYINEHSYQERLPTSSVTTALEGVRTCLVGSLLMAPGSETTEWGTFTEYLDRDGLRDRIELVRRND